MEFPSFNASTTLFKLSTATNIGPTTCRLPTLLYSLPTLLSALLYSSIFLPTDYVCPFLTFLRWGRHARMSGTLGNVESIPTESSKASTTADDIEITNYNEVIELNVEENLEDQADPSKIKKKNIGCMERMSRLIDPYGSIKAQCNCNFKFNQEKSMRALAK
ncbi:hypothetical protein M9H77_20677 [Catharanthus roseus]|uniref:Uncharacterized protein n=1 Tax=Catharanthus roseus TaxID=4058 RepID=A0ACC0ALA8_CATRO|nr:hypothetical protein M9H77_20677 [Catharanthus roseus]